jgi:NitT/TauT family transport system substrate-binding protein
MAHEPDATYYATSGAAFELADLASAEGTRASLGEVFPSTALYMPKAYVAAHPEVVQRLVNACLKALRFIESHDAKAIAAALPPKIAAQPGFLHTLEEDKAMFAGDGRIPEPAARDEWRAMSALTPKYAKIDFAATFTNAFVDRGNAKRRVR